MTSLFVDNLTVIDFSYVDIKRGLVGESIIVDVELYGQLNKQGMIFDFGHVKKALKKAIDSHCDHTLWLPKSMKGLLIESIEDGKRVTWQTKTGAEYIHESPDCALFSLESDQFCIVEARKAIEAICLKACPDNVERVSLNLRFEHIEDDYYHYSHGLKLHDGDCQRIAHGHRSRVQIFKENVRSKELESYWADKLKDGYLANADDIIDKTPTTTTFGYNAPQGRFKLSLPTAQVTLMDRDTTVENIANFLAIETQSRFNQCVKVRAFEGVEKGACAVSPAQG